MRMWRAALVVMIVFAWVALAGAGFAATAEYTLPTWPQPFGLSHGQAAGFGFPVTQPGTVTVDIEWTGAPLTVALQEMSALAAGTSGQQRLTVPGSQQQAPPRARLTFSLSAADVQRSPIWRVTLGVPAQPAPAGAPSPAAQGRIAVTAPPLDGAGLHARLQPVLEQHKAAAARFQPVSPEAVQAAAAQKRQAFYQARATKLAAERQGILAQAKTSMDSARGGLQQASAAVGAPRPASQRVAWSPAALAARRLGRTGTPGVMPPTTSYDKPTLLRMTPGQGSPGDEVVIVAGGISDDPVGKQVLFTVQPMVTLPGKIVSTSIFGTEVTLVVAVPAPPALGTPSYQGTVHLLDEKGVATNTQPFRFNPIPVPVVYQIRNAGLSRRSGDGIWLDGANFMAGSQAHFLFPWSPQLDVPANTVTAPGSGPNNLPTVVPSYTQAQRFVANVFVRYRYAAKHLQGDIDSAQFSVTLDASYATLTSATDKGDPGTSVLINGKGFGDAGEVHFQVSAGQYVRGTIVQWSDTAIVAEVPDVSGVPVNYTGTSYVRIANSQTNTPFTFTFIPAVERRALDINADLDPWNVQLTRFNDNIARPDSWGSPPSSGWIRTYHQNAFWNHHEGDDRYFWVSQFPQLPTGLPSWLYPGPPALHRLKNGWKVVGVTFSGFGFANLWNSWLAESHVGTDNPYVKVHWYVASLIAFPLPLDYKVLIEIEGPKGVPYR
jgi:hypothetical protein